MAEESPESPLFSSLFPERLTKGDRKKIEIIQAAIKISAKGVDLFSYDDLAEELKTNRSHIAYHFKERQDLIVAMIRYMMTAGHSFTFAKMQKAKNSMEQLIYYLDGYYDFFTENKEYIPLMVYFYYASTLPGALRDLQSEIRKQAHSRIVEILRLIVQDHKQRAPKSLDELATQAQTLILGGLIFNLATNNIPDREKAESSKSIILNGILSLLKISSKAHRQEKLNPA